MTHSLRFYGNWISFQVISGRSLWLRVLPGETDRCHFRGLQRTPILQPFLSQCREEFSKSKVVNKKWFIINRIGCLWDLQERLCPKNLVGYRVFFGGGGRLQFYNERKSGREFCCPCVVKLHPQIIVFYGCREHVLHQESLNLLSSLGRMWVSYYHCFIVWGHVLCFCCMVLLLCKPAFSSNP